MCFLIVQDVEGMLPGVLSHTLVNRSSLTENPLNSELQASCMKRKRAELAHNSFVLFCSMSEISLKASKHLFCMHGRVIKWQ